MERGSRAVSELARVDLNLLVALDALLDTASVTLAAERVGVGTQAMSASLARLRSLWDDPLLVRAGRGLARTAVADDLRGPVADALRLLASTVAGRRDFEPAAHRARFTVLASDYVTLVLLAHVVPVLAERAPHVTVHVRPVPADFRRRLRAGQADLVVLPREVAGVTTGLRSQQLFADRFVCVVDGARRPSDGLLTSQQFLARPFIAYDGGAIPSVAQAELARQGVRRTAEVTTRSFVAATLLVEGSDYVTIVHERLARRLAERADIALLDPPYPLGPITETLYWATRTHDDPARQWLRELLSEVAGGMDAPGVAGAAAQHENPR